MLHNIELEKNNVTNVQKKKIVEAVFGEWMNL